MDLAEGSDAPANELEALVTDLSASGPVVFVFGDGLAHNPRGRADAAAVSRAAERRWWHVEQARAYGRHSKLLVDSARGFRARRLPLVGSDPIS
jgi:hypothetical protein